MTIPTPPTRYATTDEGFSIAYQRVGDTGPNLVWIPGGGSHLELFWDLPGWAHLIRRAGSFSRLVWFDKRGTGLSDRDGGASSLEVRMLDIGAVMDAAGFDTAVLVGMSEGAAMAALFAAAFPERVERLALVAGPSHAGAIPTNDQLPALALEIWGSGVALEAMWARGITDTALLARIERAMGTPTSMAAMARANADFDVRPALPLIHAPTLVVHCRGDQIIPFEGAHEFVDLIPGAVLVEIDGDFHGSGRPDEMEQYVRPIEEFTVGSSGTALRSWRVLSTVLFTDIVDSTARATAEGDQSWSALLDDHDRICRRAVDEAGGCIVKMTGDGVLATFDGPAAAIGAAQAMSDNLGVLGLAIRSGVHTGEIERRGDDIGGIGVNIAARIMGCAGGGEVWASATVPGLSAGSGVVFAPRGPHTLKGIDGAQDLFEVSRSA